MLLNQNTHSFFKSQLQGYVNNRDEGVIKYQLNLKRAPLSEEKEILQLEKWRALFFRMGLVGEYLSDGIG